MTPRIYADFNGYYRNGDVDCVELDTLGTLIDLHRLQVRLTEGLEIMAWDQSDETEDMEVVGTCHYDALPGRRRWCVQFSHGSLAYVPGRQEPISRDFVCFRCRQPLPEKVCQGADRVCPHCGLCIDFPWQPPGPEK